MRYVQVVNRVDCTLRNDVRTACIRFRQQHRELTARITTDHVDRPVRRQTQTVGDGFQADIPLLLTKFAVIGREAFYIRKEQRQRCR